jgi:hypothetical protein
MRKIEIAYIVMIIEADEEFPVSDRYVSRHEVFPLKNDVCRAL